jgi:hypothetical protein
MGKILNTKNVALGEKILGKILIIFHYENGVTGVSQKKDNR